MSASIFNGIFTKQMGRMARWAAVAGAVIASAVLTGCPPTPPATKQAEVGDVAPAMAEVRWKVYSARRQSSFIKLDLPVLISGTVVTVGDPVFMVSKNQQAAYEGGLLERVLAQESGVGTGGGLEPPVAGGGSGEERVGVKAHGWGGGESGQGGGAVSLYSTHIVRGAAEGPLVDQLAGQPRMQADAGSYLVPLIGKAAPAAKAAAPAANGKVAGMQPAEKAEALGAGERSFEIKEPMPVYVKVTVPALMEAGEYRFPVRIAMPGRAAEEAMLSVEVADLSLPTEPRVLSVATTTIDALTKIYPETFGTITANHLDRAEAEHAAAMAQLDGLVKTARDQGVALFVEDVTPAIRVDEVGQVTTDWDAYDRVMQPYMDGTAFADHIPLPVWVAPVPPRRIRESATQLWQYIDLCSKHFAAKGWVARPAFLHPALIEGSEDAGEDADGEAGKTFVRSGAGAPSPLVTEISDILRLHMPREMLAVASPGSAVPQGQLWAINDTDSRLPPAGALGTEYSVRAWPWVCVARGGGPTNNAYSGVQGIVWRDAVARVEDLKGAPIRRPLLAVQTSGGSGTIMPTLRLLWLHAGLNDSALLGLLEKRTDAGLVSEVLAAMVGRTGTVGGMAGAAGMPATAPAAVGSAALGPELPAAPAGFLFAGWAADRTVWAQTTPLLERLILANDPGARTSVRSSDPLYLAAKAWLSQARRPVARVAGYGFSMRPGREGDILDTRVQLLVENPVDVAAEFDMRFAELPGDFDVMVQPPQGTGAGTGGAAVAVGDDLQVRRRSVTVKAASAEPVMLPLAGHVANLMQAPQMNVLELSERHGGAILRLPVALPVYRMHAVEDAPTMDGRGGDWPANDTQLKVFGEMKVGLRYLSRPDLVGGAVRQDSQGASVRWSYDRNYIYFIANCPQNSVSDERNTNWPVAKAGAGEGRWWGTDGLQVQLGAVGSAARAEAENARPVGAGGRMSDRLVKIAFKPGGVVMIQTGQLLRSDKEGVHVAWREGPPAGLAGAGVGGEIKYGIAVQKQEGRVTGYTVEAGIPRGWVDGEMGPGVKAAAWRVNVLRHRAEDLASMSWSGPMVDDGDVAMMGALIGE